MMPPDIDKIISGAVRQALARKKGTQTYASVTLAAAQTLIEKVFAEAERMGVPVIAAVADAGANTVAVARMDGAITASYDIAVNKAYTSAALRMSTADLARLAAPGGDLYGIQHQGGGKIVVFGGGEPLCAEGATAGSIGVSGGTLQQDTHLAAFAKKYWEDNICR